MGKNSRFSKACAAALTLTLAAETEKSQIANRYSKEGYHLAWHDEFNGSSLNTKDWNVEAHEPGWVNSELQSYVDDKPVYTTSDWYTGSNDNNQITDEHHVYLDNFSLSEVK